MRRDNDFRISVAGAQEKTALLWHNNQWMEPNGTTPTTKILNPQIGKLASVWICRIVCMTPLYDVVSAQPAFDQKQIPHKDFTLAMRVGQSNQYNVERLQARHFIDTGIECGLSRKVINQILESTRDEATACVEKTLANLAEAVR